METVIILSYFVVPSCALDCRCARPGKTLHSTLATSVDRFHFHIFDVANMLPCLLFKDFSATFSPVRCSSRSRSKVVVVGFPRPPQRLPLLAPFAFHGTSIFRTCCDGHHRPIREALRQSSCSSAPAVQLHRRHARGSSFRATIATAGAGLWVS